MWRRAYAGTMSFGLCGALEQGAIIDLQMTTTDRTREHHRLLRWGGLAAWLGVGLPIWSQISTVTPWRLAVWLPAWLLFAAAFWMTAGDREIPKKIALALLAFQAACVIVVVAVLCNGFEGTLLVLVAMQTASRVSRRAGLAWIGVQTVLMGIAIGFHWSPRPAFLLMPPYLGFQLLAFLAFAALEREARGREELARANAELRSARELLAQSSRAAERLRIARELHDAVGHRLVALSLNLEVASHRVEGEALEPIQVA